MSGINSTALAITGGAAEINTALNDLKYVGVQDLGNIVISVTATDLEGNKVLRMD